jgi:hypothetical protein
MTGDKQKKTAYKKKRECRQKEDPYRIQEKKREKDR